MRVMVSLQDKEPFEAEVIGTVYSPHSGTCLVVASDDGTIQRAPIELCRRITSPFEAAAAGPHSRSPAA